MASMKAKITKKVGVYSGASTSTKKKSILKKGDTVTVIQLKNDSSGNTWAKTSKGWFMSYKKSNNSEFCKLISSTKGSDGKKVNTKLNNVSKKYYIIKNAMEESLKEETGGALKKTMQLFGLPYQFLPSVDMRVNDVSKIIGRKYIENIIIDAPVVTIMPGKPSFLPGTKDKRSMTSAFLQAASGNLGALQAISKEKNIDNLRFYDFKTDYVSYMQYVNVMCRTCAAFLELEDNPMNYKINGEKVNFMNYDWKNYRWEGTPYSSTIGKVTKEAGKAVGKKAKSVFNTFMELGGHIVDLFEGKKSSNKYKVVTNNKKKKTKNKKISKNELNINDNASKLNDEETITLENLLRNIHYVQFYCDPSSGVTENMTNTTKTSRLKDMMSTGSEAVKDLAFMLNSGGANLNNELGKLGESAIGALGKALGGAVGSFNDSAGTLISRLLSTGSNILKGDSVIMPDIYANSSYTKSYQLIFNFKALYGNKTSIYMDVLSPMCHVLSLVLPKATTANTFSAPVLVKVFLPGKFTCNMGIVTSVNIERNAESLNVDGLYSEITMTVEITDLYSDLTMTPSSDPILFVNNSSLIEYLAINCGLDLVDNQFSTKVSLMFNNIKTNSKEVGTNVMSKIAETVDDLLYSLTSFD